MVSLRPDTRGKKRGNAKTIYCSPATECLEQVTNGSFGLFIHQSWQGYKVWVCMIIHTNTDTNSQSRTDCGYCWSFSFSHKRDTKGFSVLILPSWVTFSQHTRVPWECFIVFCGLGKRWISYIFHLFDTIGWILSLNKQDFSSKLLWSSGHI